MTKKSKKYQITVEAQKYTKRSRITKLPEELNLRRNPVVSNYQVLVELKIAEKSNIIIRGAKLTEKSKGYQLL